MCADKFSNCLQQAIAQSYDLYCNWPILSILTIKLSTNSSIFLPLFNFSLTFKYNRFKWIKLLAFMRTRAHIIFTEHI